MSEARDRREIQRAMRTEQAREVVQKMTLDQLAEQLKKGASGGWSDSGLGYACESCGRRDNPNCVFCWDRMSVERRLELAGYRVHKTDELVSRSNVEKVGPVYLDACDAFLSGSSVMVCGQSRTGKTLSARYVFNESIRSGLRPGFIQEVDIFKQYRESKNWRPRRAQILDNAFSSDLWASYLSNDWASVEMRFRYRELLEYMIDSRQHRLFVTCISLPETVGNMPDDLKLRWIELCQVFKA